MFRVSLPEQRAKRAIAMSSFPLEEVQHRTRMDPAFC